MLLKISLSEWLATLGIIATDGPIRHGKKNKKNTNNDLHHGNIAIWINLIYLEYITITVTGASHIPELYHWVCIFRTAAARKKSLAVCGSMVKAMHIDWTLNFPLVWMCKVMVWVSWKKRFSPTSHSTARTGSSFPRWLGLGGEQKMDRSLMKMIYKKGYPSFIDMYLWVMFVCLQANMLFHREQQSFLDLVYIHFYLCWRFSLCLKHYLCFLSYTDFYWILNTILISMRFGWEKHAQFG